MNQFFWRFCINRFGMGLLHYYLSHSDFGFEFVEIFLIEKRLPVSTIQRVTDSAYQWYGELLAPHIGDTGSRYLKEKKLVYRQFSEL